MYTVTITPAATGPVTVTISIPSSTTSAGHSQEILAYELTGDPRPDPQREETDAMGNRWAVVRWSRAAGQITLARHVRCALATQYGPIFTSSTFPLARSSLPLEAWPGLRATAEVQSTASQMRALATELVRGAVTEIEAVARILGWVQSNVRYVCSRELCDLVPRVDALSTLDRLMGNCVNFANLCLALLRAAGIPALPVNGFVADRGGSHASHAWISVFFPDLGWVEFESSNWMPAYREVPVTFLLPQHITLYRGDGRWDNP